MRLDLSHPRQRFPISAIHHTTDAAHSRLVLLRAFSELLCLQLIDLGFRVKHLDSLKSTVEESWDAVQKSPSQKVSIEEKQKRRARQAVESLLEPAAALGLRTKESRRKVRIVLLALQ